MASNYRTATAGESLQLRYSDSRAVSGLFVQCKIYDSADALKYTINLTESLVQPGRYIGNVTILIEGDYEAFYIPYDDSGHTVESELAPRASEAIRVSITQANYGGATLPPSGGITDNDIAAIIEGVNSKIGYQNPWHYELRNGKTAEEELIGKSEFNFKLDIVRIPPIEIDFKEIKSEISKQIKEIKSSIPDFSVQLRILSEQIKEIKGIKVEGVVNKIEEVLESLREDNLKFKDLVKVSKEINKLVADLNSTQALLVEADRIQLNRFNSLFEKLGQKFDLGIMNLKQAYQGSLVSKMDALNGRLDNLEL